MSSTNNRNTVHGFVNGFYSRNGVCTPISIGGIPNNPNVAERTTITLPILNGTNGQPIMFDAYKIKRHVCFYKGTVVPVTELQNDKQFYVSNRSTAKIYASPYACSFRTRRDNIVFVMSKTNLTKLLQILNMIIQNPGPGISPFHIRKLMDEIAHAYGIGVTTMEQYYYSLEQKCRFESLRKNPYAYPGRVSIKSVDASIMTGLEWFFAALGVDGVIAFTKQSVAHGGQFHPELSYFNGQSVLQRLYCARITANNKNITSTNQLVDFTHEL